MNFTDAPADEVAAERARVAREGWGAQILASQDTDGRWSGGTFFPRGVGTLDTLHLLYLFGLDPTSDGARRVIAPVHEAARRCRMLTASSTQASLTVRSCSSPSTPRTGEGTRLPSASMSLPIGAVSCRW